MDFDVIIPAYKNPDQLRACLHSLCPQHQLIREVFVCIDGPDRGITQAIEQFSGNTLHITALHHPQWAHRGRQATRNLGIRASDADLLLLLDSDLRATPHLLAVLKRELDNDELVLGNVCYTNAAESLWADYYMWRKPNINKCGGFVSARNYISQCVGVRRSLFERTGRMREEIRSYGGDLAFAYQLWNAGIRHLRYQPQAQVYGVEEKPLHQVLDEHEDLIRNTYSQLMELNSEQEFDPYQLNKIYRWARLIPLSYGLLRHWMSTYLLPHLAEQRPSLWTRYIIRFMLGAIMVGAADE
ncbi:MAG: glycosyltransferase family 2 protein [Bacteroidota bacterium]